MRTVGATTDERLAQALPRHAGMVDRVKSDPQRWLGLDEDSPPHAPFPSPALDTLWNRAFAKPTPASLSWLRLPVDQRVQWLVSGIGVGARQAAPPGGRHRRRWIRTWRHRQSRPRDCATDREQPGDMSGRVIGHRSRR